MTERPKLLPGDTCWIIFSVDGIALAQGANCDQAWRHFNMKGISDAANVRMAHAEGYYAKQVTLPLKGRHGLADKAEAMPWPKGADKPPNPVK